MTSDKKRTRPRPLTHTEAEQAVANLMAAGAERDDAIQIVNSLQWSAAPPLLDEAPQMTPGEMVNDADVPQLSDAAKERAVEAVMALPEPLDRGPDVSTHVLPWILAECDVYDAEGDYVSTIGIEADAVVHRVNNWDALCDRLERAIIERDEAQAHITCRRSERLGAERDRLRESLRSVRAESDARLKQEAARRDRLLLLQRERWRARLTKITRGAEAHHALADAPAQSPDGDLLARTQQDLDDALGALVQCVVVLQEARELISPVPDPEYRTPLETLLTEKMPACVGSPIEARSALYASLPMEENPVKRAVLAINNSCVHCRQHPRRPRDRFCSDECAAEVGADC